METKQTAIQIALESYKNDGVSFTDWFMDNSSMLLAIEKELIKDAFNTGYSYDLFNGGGEQYYKEKYGK